MSGQASLTYAKVLRLGTYYLAIGIVATGVAIALAVSDEGVSLGVFLGFPGVAFVVATILVLLVHQPFRVFGWLSAVFLILAFSAPVFFVRMTWDQSNCSPRRRVPCDPTSDFHEELRLGLLVGLLSAALLTGLAGWIRARGSSSSRGQA